MDLLRKYHIATGQLLTSQSTDHAGQRCDAWRWLYHADRQSDQIRSPGKSGSMHLRENTSTAQLSSRIKRRLVIPNVVRFDVSAGQGLLVRAGWYPVRVVPRRKARIAASAGT